MSDFTQELDARDMHCPLPVIRAKKALGSLNAGDILRIMTTDPGSVKDFESFVSQTGNDLVESTTEGSVYVFRVKKVE